MEAGHLVAGRHRAMWESVVTSAAGRRHEEGSALVFIFPAEISPTLTRVGSDDLAGVDAGMQGMTLEAPSSQASQETPASNRRSACEGESRCSKSGVPQSSSKGQRSVDL